MVNTRSSPKWDDIVVITGRTEWFDTPRHSRLKRTPVAMERTERENTQNHPQTRITLTFSTPPSSGTPWYKIGHDAGSTTDISIDCPYGISGCHLQVGFDAWGQVVVKDTSRFGCKLTYKKLVNGASTQFSMEQTAESSGNKTNPPPWVIPVGWRVSIELGESGSSLIFQAPDHSDYIEEYRRNVMKLHASQTNPLPLLGGLEIDSQRAVTQGLFTEAQRAAREVKKGRFAWIVSDKSLGEGAFGEVVQVFNTSNWCMCAGKRMKTETTFQDESSILKRLQHKHVVQYIDVEERRSTSPSMIIMEYYALGDLSKQHKSKKFSEAEIISIISQVASALKYLHGMKITHRDLKPGNILVRSRQPVEIAVADFGVAKSEESYMCTYAGTFPYMAPEVIPNRMQITNGILYYDHVVDIWSLGVVAVEMLNGKRPGLLSQKRDQSYALNIYNTRDKLLEGCENRAFAALVKDMLEWDPVKRPRAEDCLQRASSMVPVVAQGAATGQADAAGRRRGKNPAEGVGSGNAASVVRVMKRVGSDMSAATVKPPHKKAELAAPSTIRKPGSELGQLGGLASKSGGATSQSGGSASSKSGGVSPVLQPASGTYMPPGSSVLKRQ